MDRQLIDALFSLYRNGEYRALAERARALLPAHPDALVLHSLLGAALVALEDYEGAVASYRKALSLEPGFAKLHNGLGIAYLRLDRLPEAIASFREAIASDAGFAPAQFNLGMCFEHLDEWTGAAAHYRQATVLDPGHVQAFVSLGDVLWELGEHAAVSECYERALAIDARHLAAYRSLMNFLERTNQHARLNEVLARARAALGPHALVRIYEGVTADIAGEHESARAILESIRIDPADAAAMHDERLRVARLVRICDRLGDTGAALAHAREANRLSAELGARKGIGKAPFLERIARRRRYFTTANVARWPERPSSPDDAPPLFIVGFPRSGTTLLDTILRGHPDIEVAEESAAVRRMVDTLAATADDHLERLPDLADAELERLRTTYHEALREDLPEGGDGSCTVIDRFALNIVHAGEIHRAFPHARFILVLRHPADCVLSCYMQTFYETSANASFHALEDAAYLYDQLFGLWRQYTDVLDLEYVTVKYEALVEDPEAACGPLLSFIGRPWHPDLLRYQATARERAQIRTASYDQVTRALYTHARERWRRYRRALEPVLPTLAPWIEHFGYDL